MSDVIDTVWTPGAVRGPVVLRIFRQVVLPILDGLLVAFGLASFVVGSKIVEDFALPWFRPVWAIIILLGTLAALSGNIGLWMRSEFFARLASTAGLGVYAAATVAYIGRGNDSSVLTLILVAGYAVVTLFRMWWLTVDIGKEEADHEVIATRTGGTPTA